MGNKWKLLLLGIHFAMHAMTAMNTRINEVVSVELLGHSGELKWENHGDGLQVWFRKDKSCEYAYALKIGFKK